jgi:hypothetical protein
MSRQLFHATFQVFCTINLLRMGTSKYLCCIHLYCVQVTMVESHSEPGGAAHTWQHDYMPQCTRPGVAISTCTASCTAVQVTVVESHSEPGGAAHTWKRGGYHFESGPSLYSGMNGARLSSSSSRGQRPAQMAVGTAGLHKTQLVIQGQHLLLVLLLVVVVSSDLAWG